jgi:WD40 repeat protein
MLQMEMQLYILLSCDAYSIGLHRSTRSQKQGLLVYSTFIFLFKIRDECCVSTLQGHDYGVECLEETPNGYIISGAWDNTIRIWNLARNKCVKVLRGSGPNKDLQTSSNVKSLQVLREGDLFASGFWDNSIIIWNYLSGECVKKLVGHSCCVYGFELTAYNELISCSLDSTIKMWDIKGKNETCIQLLNGHSDGVTCVKLLTNDKLLSLSRDNSIKMWDLDTGECLQTIKTKNQVSNLELCSIVA